MMKGVATRRIALVTGSTDGIGLVTAKWLSAHPDFQVLIHGRSQERIQKANDIIKAEVPSANLVLLAPYDLSSIQQTKDFAAHVIDTVQDERLDVLINNAGVFTGPSDERLTTEDNLEVTFAVNVVAPFIICSTLLPLLKKTDQSRIINVASMSQGGRILSDRYFPRIDGSARDAHFSSHEAYSHSKLCMAALNHELAIRISSDDALCNSCDPGTVNTKMLLSGWGRCGIDLEEARTEFDLSTRDFDPVTHGQYFIGTRQSRCSADVYDEEARLALWQKLETLTGVKL